MQMIVRYWASVDSNDGVRSVQRDLDRTNEWCRVWGMECRVIHFGAKEPAEYHYTINQHVIESSTCERDSGVLVSSDLKWKNQVEAVAGKANRILGMLRKAFQHNSVDL